MNLVIEGNVAAARKLATSFWDEAIFGKENTKQYVKAHSDVNYVEVRWTSIQQEEAAAVLQEILTEKHKKCNYCKRINPKIESHTYGWLETSQKASDITASIIEDSSLELTSAGGKIGTDEEAMERDEVLQPRDIENALALDGELLEPVKSIKGTKNSSRDLHPELIKQIFSLGRVDLLPPKVEGILKALWRNESKLCKLICDIQCRSLNKFERENGYAMFFLKSLLVPPNKFRPSAQGQRALLEHPQNVLLSKVVESNIYLSNSKTNSKDILQKWRALQNSVNLLFDSSKGFVRSGRTLNGIRQLLDKKEGILRQKMMGKRVNFACRSVISPDPYLAVNEIGIPPYFALRLIYPERVTPWNVNKLRHAVLNGADFHPGATHYKDRDNVYKLQTSKAMNLRNAISRKLPTSRAITKVGMGPEMNYEGKFVYRHLQDGDIVLVNRQPTLHKPSMMAHVVRVLKGEKTIRMHYANCSTYNADFDGDEMNVHFPQDEISRAELFHIVNANKQYIVPTSGDPIRGLIQDHIVSAVLLTKMDTFLTREDYNQLLYASCVPLLAHGPEAIKVGQKISALVVSDEILPLPPAIWKPVPLWTGKQVITAVLHYITKGHLPLTIDKEGRIPKEYFGKDATERKLFVYNNELIHGIIDKAQFGKYGLVHTVHELYGADTAGQLLAVFSRLFTSFLQLHGFTCGMDDLLVVRKSDRKRTRILENSEGHSEDVHSRFTGTTKRDLKDPLKLLKETEKVIRRNGESATTRLDRMMSNALNALTSEVNKILFPAGLQKPFPKNCLSLMTSTGAKGGLVNMTQISSLLGQQELEGKRVPRMVSGKTLPCFPAWDISSRAGGFISDRFLTGLRPQEYYFHCMAGREGLVDTAVKTSRSGYLQRCLVKNLECLKVCYDYTVRDADGSIIQFTYGEDGVDVQKSSFLGEFEILTMNHKVFIEKMGCQLEHAHLSKSNGYIKDLPGELKEKAADFLSQLSKNSKGFLHRINRKDMMKVVKFMYLSCLAEPGEAVGVIAAQSVGEPSTQMTQDAEFIAAKLGRICLADIIESIEICTVPFSTRDKQVYTIYKLTLKLYSPEHYPPLSGISIEACMDTLRKAFIHEMDEEITKHLVMLSKISGIRTSSVKNDDEFAAGDLDSGSKLEKDRKNDTGDDNDNVRDANGNNDAEDNVDANEDDEDDDGSAEDLGADAEKLKRQARDEMEYDDDFEKERSAFDDEYDGTQPRHEGESDLVETEEDYEIGGQVMDAEVETEGSQSPSRIDSIHLLVANKDEVNSEVEGKMIIKGRRKKGGRILLVESKGLKFEVHFQFGKDEPHVLLAELAQNTAKRVYVKACKNIDRCSVLEPKRNGDPPLVQTAGVNFNALWDLHEYIDINKIVTNNIHAMLTTYGVEAARATIINEVKGVFDAYGIRVNIRHLMLIADLMTSNGEYRPLNRLGMSRFSTSPFSKMSFETAANVITEAALHGDVDTMDSPSACVSLGKVVKLGTGGFDLLQNIQL